MRIVHVVGARPNFMKIAPIMRAMADHPQDFAQLLVHTGQHYDASMSKVFFEDLDLPQPDANLEVGSGSHAWQTAQVMLRFEHLLQDFKADWVVVPGDVNSTIACALVASKLGVRIAHVEAGLRSFDRMMPEEINRVLTDHISDLLFTTEASANENLSREGIAGEQVQFVGNVMIDTLVRLLPKAEQNWRPLQQKYDLDRYMLVTLHRPSNVDDPATLSEICAALEEASREINVLFPVHPRTRQRVRDGGLLRENSGNIRLVEPLGYLDFLALQTHATLVLTDSGGVQEETTFLGVPCLTSRPNTERPVTLTHGTNRLVASERKALVRATSDALTGDSSAANVYSGPPDCWDGHAANRIVEVLRRWDRVAGQTG